MVWMARGCAGASQPAADTKVQDESAQREDHKEIDDNECTQVDDSFSGIEAP